MKFLCDQMLEDLAKWLRTAGYDTKISGPKESDQEIFDCAMKEERILLTCDRDFLEKKENKSIVFLSGNDLQEYVKQLNLKLKINWLLRPFSRCLLCNSALVKPDPETILAQAPSDVIAHSQQFWYCPECQKLYWEGSHTEHMLDQLHQFQIVQ